MPAQFLTLPFVNLHFEVIARIGEESVKYYFGPYAIKGNYQEYPDSYEKDKRMGTHGTVLWKIGLDGLSQYYGMAHV